MLVLRNQASNSANNHQSQEGQEAITTRPFERSRSRSAFYRRLVVSAFL